MARPTPRLVNLAATVIAVVMLLTAGGRLKAYLFAAQEQPASSAESTAQREAKEEEAKDSPKREVFLWFNFFVIAGAFGYLIKKNLVPFLNARAAAIREDMDRSKAQLEDATRRLAGVEQQLIHMDQEITALRNSAIQEATAERARIEDTAKAEAEKVARAAEQEIEAAAKAARQELKAFAAELSIGLAEKKILASISPDSESVIFRSFLHDLTEASNGSAKTGPERGGA